MIATIEITLNWPAASVILTIVGTATVLLWKLDSKIDDHSKDNNRHLTGQNFVSSDVCKTTKEGTEKQLTEIRKYISDVKNDLGSKLDRIYDALLNGTKK